MQLLQAFSVSNSYFSNHVLTSNYLEDFFFPLGILFTLLKIQVEKYVYLYVYNIHKTKLDIQAFPQKFLLKCLLKNCVGGCYRFWFMTFYSSLKFFSNQTNIFSQYFQLDVKPVFILII